MTAAINTDKSVLSGADGRFNLTFPRPTGLSVALPKFKQGSFCALAISIPGRPQIPPYIAEFNNREERSVDLMQPRARHSFVFVDEKGTRLDPRAINPTISYAFTTQYGEDKAYRKVIYDPRSGGPLPGELELPHGSYSFTAAGAILPGRIEVTAESPNELVVQVKRRNFGDARLNRHGR